MPGPNVALVSSDLLFASRLRAALAGIAQVALVAGDDVPTASTVFVDLNDRVEDRLTVIRTLRASGGAQIIGFCQHDERSVRVRAMEQGADQVVTNGALQQAAIRMIADQPRG